VSVHVQAIAKRHTITGSGPGHYAEIRPAPGAKATRTTAAIISPVIVLSNLGRTMKQPDLATEIDMFGRMTIALLEIEECREFISLIPEVRTNMVFAHPRAKTPDEVMAVDGRITIINSMPRAAGRVRFGASSHMARLIIELMKTDPSVRAGIDFANPPRFSDWLADYGIKQGWVSAMIDRRIEPAELMTVEGSSMQWKAAEAVRAAGGTVPKIICDAGGMGKEPVCILTGKEPISLAREVCGIARAYAQLRE